MHWSQASQQGTVSLLNLLLLPTSSGTDRTCFHNSKVTPFPLWGISASCSHPRCLGWDAVPPKRLSLPPCRNELHLIACPLCLISLPSSLASKFLILPQTTSCVSSLLSSPQKGNLWKSREPVLLTQETQGLFSKWVLNKYLLNKCNWINTWTIIKDFIIVEKTLGFFFCLEARFS